MIELQNILLQNITQLNSLASTSNTESNLPLVNRLVQAGLPVVVSVQKQLSAQSYIIKTPWGPQTLSLPEIAKVSLPEQFMLQVKPHPENPQNLILQILNLPTNTNTALSPQTITQFTPSNIAQQLLQLKAEFFQTTHNLSNINTQQTLQTIQNAFNLNTPLPFFLWAMHITKNQQKEDNPFLSLFKKPLTTEEHALQTGLEKLSHLSAKPNTTSAAEQKQLFAFPLYEADDTRFVYMQYEQKPNSNPYQAHKLHEFRIQTEYSNLGMVELLGNLRARNLWLAVITEAPLSEQQQEDITTIFNQYVKEFELEGHLKFETHNIIPLLATGN